MRILIVDDTPANRRLLMRITERLGHSADAASSGDEALSLAAQGEYDLVLLDLQMPGIDGFETARLMRAGPAASARIWALTGFSEDEVREPCARAGIDRVITKPFTLEQIDALLRGLGEERAM